MHQGWQINVQGIVQGVGFRPFVYRLAHKFGFTGSVTNTAAGVQIEVTSPKKEVLRFIEALEREAPPLAQIIKIELNPQKIFPASDFTISDSDPSDLVSALISPDIATCDDCIEELLNPDDHRYLYSFINCTNCGPRYTIIIKIPYDRPNTSMSPFRMCPQCMQEYEDPEDRRFHAQPNACPKCGPHLQLLDSKGKRLQTECITTAIKALKSGKIVAIKGLGGFHLAVDAENEKAVQSLRQRKFRFEKPLAVMTADIESARQLVDLTPIEEKYLLSAIRPIVLCRKKKGSGIAASLSLDNDDLGLMLPYTPLHQVLFRQGKFRALVMTSANISEEPICYKNDETLGRLSKIADIFLMHNRDIYTRCDDSVVRIFMEKPFYLRKSRGYAPRPVLIDTSGPPLMAVGGQLKNTIALSKENRIFLSQHIGDLENLETLSFFEHTITYLQRLFEIEPALIFHDKHPEYLSTKWAKENSVVFTSGVQHHYAHILSVMAENNITEPVIGIALDGTGFGDDGTIWGGEILICDTQVSNRFAHLETIAMPGGELAIKEPWRMAIAYLKAIYSEWKPAAHELFPKQQNKIDLTGQQIDKKINSPMTSSCGRLFDAVAAILGIRDQVSYEGQAAIILESLAKKVSGEQAIDIGTFQFNQNDTGTVISAHDIIRHIVRLRANKISCERISHAFHYALVAMLVQVVGMAAEETGIKQVALSGGCFQNMLLLSTLKERLTKLGYTVFFNQVVPVNDGGISLGQAYWGINNYKSII